MTWLLDNKPQSDNGFIKDGIQYPPNWIRNAEQASREAIGITIAPPEKEYDQRFSFGWNNAGSSQIWKDLTNLKKCWKEMQESSANAYLSDSDWRVIKSQEIGEALPDDWKTYRAAVRTACNNRQSLIDTASTSEALQTLITKREIEDTTKEKKDTSGNSFNPPIYEMKANPDQIDVKYPWPDAITS